MKRLINVRTSVIIAVGLILGVISAHELYMGDRIFGMATLVLLACALILLICIKSRFGYVIVAMVFLLLGFVRTEITFYYFDQTEITCQTVVLTGRVTDKGRNMYQTNTLYLENCVTENGITIPNVVKLHVYYGSYNTGDVVTVRGKLSSTYPVKSKINTSLVRSKAYYEFSSAEVLEVHSGTLKLDETVRKYICDCCSNMKSYGNVAYSLLTGDSNALDETTETSLKRAGIIHIMAVSGLHVGFVVAVLAFVVKRFKFHPLLELAIILVPLTFYAYVCAFTPSVMRAIIMLVCVYLSRALYGQTDMLTSLGWAVTVILLIQPLYLYDVGFQLSALSVYGIATLYSAVNRKLFKVKLPRIVRKLIDSLVLSFSCSVATLFAVALYYGQVPTLGIVVNLIAIPIVSLVFVLVVFGLIPSVFSYLLYGADFLLTLLVKVADLVSNLSIATVEIVSTSFAIVVTVLLLFVLGGYVNLNKKQNVIVSSCLGIVIVLSLIISVIPKKCSNQIKVFSSYGDNVIVATSSSGEIAIVSDLSNSYVNDEVIQYVGNLDGEISLYCTAWKNAEASVVQSYTDLPVTRIYVLDSSYNNIALEVAESIGIKVLYLPDSYDLEKDISVSRITFDYVSAVIVDVDGITVASVITKGAVTQGFATLRSDIDLYVLPSDTNVLNYCQKYYITPSHAGLEYNYGANKYGHFTIRQKDDTLILSFR